MTATLAVKPFMYAGDGAILAPTQLWGRHIYMLLTTRKIKRIWPIRKLLLCYRWHQQGGVDSQDKRKEVHVISTPVPQSRSSQVFTTARRSRH